MNILLIDGGKAFGHSAGRLNHTLHQTARDTLSALGHHVRETVIDRVSPTEGYGTGGLLQGRRHMLSLTWNAPREAFIREGDFFEGVGVDALYMHFHKANEFLGTTQLPTFICNDVIKNPQVEQYLADYTAHLNEVFGRA